SRRISRQAAPALPPCQAPSGRHERVATLRRRLQPQTRLRSSTRRSSWCRGADDGDQLQLLVSRHAESFLRSFLVGLVCLYRLRWPRPCLVGGFRRAWLFPSFQVVVWLRSLLLLDRHSLSRLMLTGA